MRNYETITSGTEVMTLYGCLIPVDINAGCVVTCEKYECGCNDDMMYCGYVYLSLKEIEKEMKNLDGKNHNIRWED